MNIIIFIVAVGYVVADEINRPQGTYVFKIENRCYTKKIFCC